MTPYYEPGLYKCRILDQGYTEASTGTEQFWIKFLVLKAVEPVRDNLEKYSRMAYFPLTDKTADRVMRDLRALGFKGDDFELLDPCIEGHHSFVGNEPELMCSVDKSLNGTPREKWGPRGVPRPLDRDRVRRLNRFLAKRPVDGSPLPAADGVSEDDLTPF